MTFQMLSGQEDFKIVTKGGGTVIVPSVETSAYLMLSGDAPSIPSTYKTYSDTLSSLSNDGYLTAHQSLSDYYTKNETSSASEISTALANAGGGSNVSVDAILTSGTQIATISVNNVATTLYAPEGGGVVFDDRISGISGVGQLSVIKLSSDEYAEILSNNMELSNALYVLDEQYANAFGSAIRNVGAPSVDTDAATKGYVDTSLLGYQPSGNYLTAVPTTYKTYSDTVTTLTGTSGFKTYSQTLTALSGSGYATTAQVNSKSTVSCTQIATTGTNIASITIDGNTTQLYAPNGGGGSNIQVSADYSSGTRIATISVDNVPTSIYVPGGSSGSSRYALVDAQLQSSGGSLSCAVQDQAITTISISSSSTPVIVQLPAQPQDGARDFILRIEISSSTAPSFTFNGVNETIDFDSEDADWAVLEPGLNIISFTETKRGTGNEGGGSQNNTYYTVTFDSETNEGGSLEDPNDCTRQVLSGDIIGELPEVFEEPTYFLHGWFTEATGGTQILSSTIVTNDITCYAQYYSGGSL